MTNNIWRDEVGAAMIAGPEYVPVSSGDRGTAPGHPRSRPGGVAQVERRLDGGAEGLLVHPRPAQGAPPGTVRGPGEAWSRPIRLPYPSPAAVTERGILVRGGYVLTSSTPEMIEDGAVRIVGKLIGRGRAVDRPQHALSGRPGSRRPPRHHHARVRQHPRTLLGGPLHRHRRGFHALGVDRGGDQPHCAPSRSRDGLCGHALGGHPDAPDRNHPGQRHVRV